MRYPHTQSHELGLKRLYIMGVQVDSRVSSAKAKQEVF